MHPSVRSNITYNSQDRKQSKCPSTDKWIKKMWYVCIYVCMYIMEYYLAIQKNEILPFTAMWMDLKNIMLSEMSQRQILCITYVETKIIQMNEYAKQKQNHTYGKQTSGY